MTKKKEKPAVSPFAGGLIGFNFGIPPLSGIPANTTIVGTGIFPSNSVTFNSDGLTFGGDYLTFGVS